MASAPKLETLPTHVAIIMDGNGRWARKRHLPRQAGHAAGLKAVREVVHTASEIGLKHLTMYAFSSENWKRPATEVGALMGLFRNYFKTDMQDLIQRNVRVNIIGNRARADQDILGMIEEAELRSKSNTGLRLTFAFDYGSQEEITAAARSLAQAAKDGRVDPADISPEIFAGYLFTGGTPAPDLVIRTSGEHRMSNFLLWQSAYAELLFVDTLWPDFGREKFIAALVEYGQRERRFGALDSEAVA